MLRRLAQIKFKLMRVNPYIQFFNTVVLLSLAGWQDWYLLAVAGVVAAYLFEKRHGIAGEMDMTWRNSDEWHKFKVEWTEIRRLLLRGDGRRDGDGGDVPPLGGTPV